MSLSATPARSAQKNGFRLSRSFSLTSLFGVLVVTVSLLWTYGRLTDRHMVEHEGRANSELTHAFSNSVWGQYRDFVLGSSSLTKEQLRSHPILPKIRADVLEKMKGLHIAKIKIYNMSGITVFSTDEKQIGEDKSSNDGFRKARDGTGESQITHRERFDALEQVINNRDLIASYVPVRWGPDAPVEGVFEVYSDVTEMLASQRQAQWEVAGVVLGLLTLLYLFLFLAVHRADRIMSRQERDRIERENEALYQAHHDSLTGLSNRSQFAEQLRNVLSLSTRKGRRFALLFIDLDRFKFVNDSLGHQAGDELLKVISARMTECLRDSHLLFRMGGDEFTIILPDTDTPEEVAVAAHRIIERVSLPVTIREHEVTVGGTVGIAMYPRDGDSVEELLRNADAAMYAAKADGRGSYSFYCPEMNQQAIQRMSLESAIKKGFYQGEFAIEYQARVDAASRRVVGFEALLRWNHPSRGLLLPNAFMSVLEQSGMMAIVGEWILRSVCNQVCAWRRRGMRPMCFSVNVSPVQFASANFVSVVEQVLSESGMPADLLELELTETVLIRDPKRAATTISALKDRGVRVSIDDFGTGFSSLSHLREFPVDCIKIDRSFASDVMLSPRAGGLAAAIIGLGQALGIRVVAEGIETEEQATFFAGAGSNELQGFLFTRSLVAERVESYLASQDERGASHPQTDTARLKPKHAS